MYALQNPNTFELCSQIISDLARDMASKPPSIFNKTFDRVFQKHLVGKSQEHLFHFSPLYFLLLISFIYLLSRLHPEYLNFGSQILEAQKQVTIVLDI